MSRFPSLACLILIFGLAWAADASAMPDQGAPQMGGHFLPPMEVQADVRRAVMWADAASRACLKQWAPVARAAAERPHPDRAEGDGANADRADRICSAEARKLFLAATRGAGILSRTMLQSWAALLAARADGAALAGHWARGAAAARMPMIGAQITSLEQAAMRATGKALRDAGLTPADMTGPMPLPLPGYGSWNESSEIREMVYLMRDSIAACGQTALAFKKFNWPVVVTQAALDQLRALGSQMALACRSTATLFAQGSRLMAPEHGQVMQQIGDWMDVAWWAADRIARVAGDPTANNLAAAMAAAAEIEAAQTRALAALEEATKKMRLEPFGLTDKSARERAFKCEFGDLGC